MLWWTLQAKRAACLLAAAQHAAADELQPAKRRRQRSMRAYVGHPEHVLLGARISVYWPDDDAFYKVCILSSATRFLCTWLAHTLQSAACHNAAPIRLIGGSSLGVMHASLACVPSLCTA